MTAATAGEAGPLVNARQIRTLAPAKNEQPPSARVQGVVTFHEPETGITYVQDDTGGIALAAGKPSQLAANVRAGMRVDVQGVAAQGSFAPVLAGRAGKPPAVTVLGPAAMPAPLSVGIEELLGGKNDGRWVEIRGTVRFLAARPFAPEIGEDPEDGTIGTTPAPTLRLSLELGTAAGRFTVIIPWTPDRPPPDRLLDSRVRVRGVLGSIVNPWRQWVGLLLYVPSLDEVRVERLPSADPFALPVRRADEIMGFSSETPGEDRVRVRGVVTLVQPGFRIFLRSDGGPLEVQTSQALAGVVLGAHVDVVGYPTLGAKRALLQDGQFRMLAGQTPPSPRVLSRSEVLASYADGELVHITGRLFQNALRGTNRVMVLEAEGQLLEAKFAVSLTPEQDRKIALLRPGAELGVTGIAQVLGRADWGGGVKPSSVSLLLRGPQDVTVLHEPPWWTPGRLLAVMGALALLLVFGATWVVLLRRRVAAQTDVIREQAFREAHERERRRIAQDIHDDLGSRLTQLALLGARVKAESAASASTVELGERISTTARSTVQTMDEIVWAINPGNDTLQSLGDYLCKVATSLLSGAEIACQLEVPAVLPVRSLSADQRHNLVLAVREALHNVVKHSRATEAGLGLRFDGTALEIEVWDNGAGIPSSGAGRGNGLGNLRRRLADLGGTCEIVSTPGAGTRVRLRVTLHEL
jgi:signal transduction histidine kinase